MILEKSTALLFSFHLVLLFVKGWFFYHIVKVFHLTQAPIKEKFMLLFEKIDIGLLFIVLLFFIDEIHYLSTFFYRAIPHIYQYVEIVGIIYLMIFIVMRLQKGKI